MNVFYKFTRKSLLKNRTRTLVTIIGIMLSMSLFTAVIEGAYSGVEYLRRSESDRSGRYHGFFYNLTKDEAEQAQNLAEIKDSATWQEVGWAKIDNENEYKPYILVESISDNFTDFVAVNLINGRLPENASEILLPQHLFEYSEADFNIGDTLTLDIGKRTTLDGFPLYTSNPYSDEVQEIIADPHKMTYTVVGTYKRLDWSIEDYGSPGYIALTAGGGTGEYHVFFTVKHPSRYYKFEQTQTVSENIMAHHDLIRLYGTLRNGNLTTVVYGFMAILIFLISFGSISLIYNSFSISVSERTKQFGILKSVGATKKQIRKSVMYEAFLLGGIGIAIGMIVGCVGIGLTLYFLRDSFSIIGVLGTDTQMKLVLSPQMLILSALICMLTTLISAWIPAKRAIKISAIDAIRQSRDMKIKSKEVKTSKLTQKLFGFEGMMASKNFKRNRKRYRSTVISLFLSVTLFISASSFCAYLTDSVEGINSASTAIDISYYTAGENMPDPDKVFAKLSSVDGVKDGSYYIIDSFELRTDRKNLTDDYIENMAFTEASEQADIYGCFVMLDDEDFRAFCKDNGLNPDEYFDKSAPKSIVYNKYITQRAESDGAPMKWYSYNVFNSSSLPCVAYYTTPARYDGYVLMDEKTDENGKRFLVYYPEEYINELYRDYDGDVYLEPDESKAMAVSAEEAEILVPLTINAKTDKSLFFMPSNAMYLIYPYSMTDVFDEMLKYSFSSYQTNFVFTVEDHTQAYDDMKKLLDESNMDTSRLHDQAKEAESSKQLVTVINVFAYGFIILISLIAITNVFNTISTNIALRRREFAMLKSIGLSSKGFRKMMNYECIIYGVKGLIWGLPASVIITFIIYKVTEAAYDSGFYIPWYSVAIAVGSVFVVVFATMLYSTGKIKKDNPIDALKNENL